MAYNFYNVGIMGEEIKRRLNLLAGINGMTDGGVATQKLVNESIQSAINLRSDLNVAYLDTGVVSQRHIASQKYNGG